MEDFFKFYKSECKSKPNICEVLLKGNFGHIFGVTCFYDTESLLSVEESYTKCVHDCRACSFYDESNCKCNKPSLKIKFCYE